MGWNLDEVIDDLITGESSIYDYNKWYETLTHLAKVGVAGAFSFLFFGVHPFLGISAASATFLYAMTGLNDIWLWVT